MVETEIKIRITKKISNLERKTSGWKLKNIEEERLDPHENIRNSLKKLGYEDGTNAKK